ASMGARLALSRRTLVAAIAAVTGVVGALTFGTSLDHLARTPRLSGEPWDTQVIFQSDGESLSAREAPRLAKDERVGALSQYGLFEARLRTDHRVQGMAVDRLKGEVAPTVVKGRLPNSQDEIAVDPGTVPGPGPRIGATLRVQAGGDPQRMTVVGTLTGTGAGFVVTSAAAKRLAADIADAGFLLAWRPGVDTAAAVRDLHKTFADVEGPVTADRVANIDDARGFPYALSLFLGLLGLLATGHLLMTTVRRRRLDLAVARALGFTLGQARAVAARQATTVAAVAVVAGVPLGLAVGRWAWAAVAGALRVVDESPTPVLATALAAAAALVLANALAALPALRAGRIRPADVLRAE
ncbi:MAG: putative transport system permease protein, partial [Actinomycetota bacterium]|nr:putative transport system permease protein [Actinomycetota bacterium]